MKPTLHILAALTFLAGTGAAFAQSAGTWTGRLGAIKIAPQVSSSDMTAPSFPGTKTDVGDSSQLGGGLTYMVTDHVALDLPLAPGFKHDLYGAGALAGAGTLASVKVLPVTLMGQYRFGQSSAKWRPYAGLGLTYAYFFDETGSGTLTALTNPGGSPTRISVESKFGFTYQLGMRYAIDDKWSVDTSISKTSLKTRTSFSTGQTLDTRLDPITYSIAVGMRF